MGSGFPTPSQSQEVYLGSKPFCSPLDADLYLWEGVFPLFQDMMFLIEQVPPYSAPSCFSLGSQMPWQQDSSFPK